MAANQHIYTYRQFKLPTSSDLNVWRETREHLEEKTRLSECRMNSVESGLQNISASIWLFTCWLIPWPQLTTAALYGWTCVICSCGTKTHESVQSEWNMCFYVLKVSRVQTLKGVCVRLKSPVRHSWWMDFTLPSYNTLTPVCVCLCVCVWMGSISVYGCIYIYFCLSAEQNMTLTDESAAQSLITNSRNTAEREGGSFSVNMIYYMIYKVNKLWRYFAHKFVHIAEALCIYLIWF